jgi:acetoin utilization protein AcuB
MIVGNWMQPNPVTVTGETLVSEAKRLISENNLQALPVLDERGGLRGLVTKSNLLRQVHFVLRTQNQDEFAFFVSRLRVRDIMVRNPGTVQVDDTVEHCLKRGKELGVAQFPVMNGARVVGVISANEIFGLAAHIVGAWEQRNGVTLAPVRLGPGVLGRIIDVAEAAGADLHAVYPMPSHPAGPDGKEDGHRTVVLRFRSAAVGAVASALEAAGFPVVARSPVAGSELAA